MVVLVGLIAVKLGIFKFPEFASPIEELSLLHEKLPPGYNDISEIADEIAPLQIVIS